VLNPWNIDALQELEQESGRRVYTILQLRVHPSLVALREKLQRERPVHKHEITDFLCNFPGRLVFGVMEGVR
jgi:UDP-N-acetyl-2-amino-2-deoxyglucuronate dehydrogenase